MLNVGPFVLMKGTGDAIVFSDHLWLNPYHAEFLKCNNPYSIFGTFHYHFRDIKMKTWSWSANSIEPGQTARKFMMCILHTIILTTMTMTLNIKSVSIGYFLFHFFIIFCLFVCLFVCLLFVCFVFLLARYCYYFLCIISHNYPLSTFYINFINLDYFNCSIWKKTT